MWLSACLLLSCICQVRAVWPAPQSFSSGNSVVWIRPDVHVIYNSGNVWWNPLLDNFLESQTEQVLDVQSSYSRGRRDSTSGQSIVHQGVARALSTLFKQNLVPWKLVPRNQLAEFEPAANSKKTYISTLTISQTGADNSSTFKPLAGQVDESYTVSIGTDGAAKISAVSAVGVLRAMETFIQLFYEHSSGAGAYSNLAPVLITDAPKFQHRGLNLDVSRNWFPVKDILRTIDAISMNKFNRFHIHMTDAQSWPMDIPALPELSAKGAYQTGLSYTPSDIQKIQTYANARGIEVIIEFDMPGHTTSIGLSHPDLIAAFNAKPWDTYCAEPPCGSLKLNSPAVDDFLEKLFDDVLPRVAPYSTYFHTGGDEVNVNTYLLDDTVKSNDTAVLGPLIQKLVDRNHAQIRAAGLTPIVWEEMLLHWNLTLGEDVVVQAWQSDENVAAITAKGHKALAGNYNYWYLDCGKGQWLNFDNGASFQKFFPFPDYCSPSKNWRLVYSYDPLGGVPEDQTHLVLGGEVHNWSEQTDPVNLDDMLWPRAGAAAEVLWSGRQDASGQNRSQITAAPRLAEMRERMVLRGISSGPVQMVHCTQHNATECAL
ncbi:putative beta-hexosaminidase alpha chain [Venustampulla echinocandica]|uniref:Beta-hexosaminidase n=1 Tax=Venustampulla echinocandica TaxID=2656787 RepID=A0A370THI7_9HELO|nr:putative beta-hexosaminidase alpha chain [Venustampulla echinocandica]RDL34663.1 putative beta-hexosaminidase alpha chain [Venustampulla echinocandica]